MPGGYTVVGFRMTTGFGVRLCLPAAPLLLLADPFLVAVCCQVGGAKMVSSFETSLPQRIRRLPLDDLFELAAIKKVSPPPAWRACASPRAGAKLHTAAGGIRRVLRQGGHGPFSPAKMRFLCGAVS